MNTTSSGYIELQPYIWRSYLEEALEGAKLKIKEADKAFSEKRIKIAKKIFERKRHPFGKTLTMDECLKIADNDFHSNWYMVESANKINAVQFELRINQELLCASMTSMSKETGNYHIDIDWYNKILRHGRRYLDIEKRRLEQEAINNGKQNDKHETAN